MGTTEDQKDEVDDYKDDDDNEEDDVTSINIKHQIDAIRYYIMMGYLYKGNFYARLGGDPEITIMKVYHSQAQHRGQRRSKRRMGMVQTAPMMPGKDECRFLDKLSQQICFYPLQHSLGLRFKKTCANTNCYDVGNKRELNQGAMESLTPGLKEGT